MTYEKDGDTLRITLHRDFNLLTARKVRRLCGDVNTVYIDLSRSKFVDTEGIIVLFELIRGGKTVRLHQPRHLFRGHRHSGTGIRLPARGVGRLIAPSPQPMPHES